MEISIKEEYKGQLGMRWVHREKRFEYILTHYTYPRPYAEVVVLQDGDEMVIRQPGDGSIIMKCTVDLEHDSFKVMDTDDGIYRQSISGQNVSGLQRGVEPSYWITLFNNGYHADIIRKV